MCRTTFLTPTEDDAIIDGLRSEDYSLWDMEITQVVVGLPRVDEPLRRSGIFRICCHGVCREYSVAAQNSRHVDNVLSDIESGIFPRNPVKTQ